MSDYVKERNQRQFQLMRRILSRISPEMSTSSLNNSIDDLDALLQALESFDVNWIDRFQKQWGILEDVNAFALDKVQTTFSDEDRKLLESALAALRLLVDEAISSNGEEEID
jgi:hypothetical protein